MLTPDQRTVLYDHVVASTDPAIVSARTVSNHIVIADAYNQPSGLWVWREDVSADEYSGAIDPSELLGLETNEPATARVFDRLTGGLTRDLHPARSPGRVGALLGLLAGKGCDTTIAALTALVKAEATLFESLYLDTSGGDGSLATPAKRTVTGLLNFEEVGRALRPLYPDGKVV